MEGLKDCIGRMTDRRDFVSERTVSEFEATLSPHLFVTGEAPLGIHWCLSPDMVTPDQIGEDGHPKLGAFLPDVGLPRRMWASGELSINGDFKSGDVVRKQSQIIDVSFKTGKTGKLCFFKINHRYSVHDTLILDELQDVVYREASAARNSPAQSPVHPKGTVWTVAPTSTMLFRYSAMTFNGHRIHYDDPYARNVEGYGGLVVHGPMQATLMLNLAASILGRTPKTFSYRGVSPLILGTPFVIDAVKAEGVINVQTISTSGVVTMTGQASI